MKGYWYFSFATQTEFLGAVVTEANDFESGLARINSLGLNPGGECVGFPTMPEDDALREVPDRLLTKEDVMSRNCIAVKDVEGGWEAIRTDVDHGRVCEKHNDGRTKAA